MQRWENLIAGPMKAEDAAEEVKNHGLNGFELVSVSTNGGWFYIALKRPLIENERVVEAEPTSDIISSEPRTKSRKRVQE